MNRQISLPILIATSATLIIGWTIFNNTTLNITSLERFSEDKVIETETYLQVKDFKVVHIARTKKATEIEVVSLLWPILGERVSASKDSGGVLSGEIVFFDGSMTIFCSTETVRAPDPHSSKFNEYSFSEAPELRNKCTKGENIFNRYTGQ